MSELSVPARSIKVNDEARTGERESPKDFFPLRDGELSGLFGSGLRGLSTHCKIHCK